MILEQSIVNEYRGEINTYDEMIDSKGQVRPHWKQLFDNINTLGIKEIKNRHSEILAALRENGVTYNVYGDPNGHNRPWHVDPIPFILDRGDWAHIEKGLKQRANVLNMLLEDIYGPRNIIKNGILPLEVIFNHSGFLRQCDRIRIPGAHQLVMYASDIARGPDGRMWVLNDRAQAPSGSGYAIENRSVMNRMLPELQQNLEVRKLSGFYHSMQSSMIDILPKPKDNPRIVLLTPGPGNETYFEHAYLAAYLGYTLAQGDDLIVRDGFVWLKSIHGLEKVDVIIRRIDDAYCDPLELKEDSQLGVAGLLEAMRRGNVTVVNPPGSSILENNAIFAFLPAVCKYFLGEDLLLPTTATWWCGQPKELNYVLANINKLLIKKVDRQARFKSVYGKQLSSTEIQNLVLAIKAEPHLFVGQEEVGFSTTPALINNKLEPRFAATRYYVLADKNEYHVMPGGLTRSSPEKGTFTISNQYGGIAKDTWIIGEATVYNKVNLQPSNVFQTINHIDRVLPSRSAENLYWVGRYCERILNTARLIGIVIKNIQENQKLDSPSKNGELNVLLRALTHLTISYPGFVGDETGEMEKKPQSEIYALVGNLNKSGSIAHNLEYLLRAIQNVRDRWSLEVWRIVDLIDESAKKISDTENFNNRSVLHLLDQLSDRLTAFCGLIGETMPRSSGWLLLETGKRIERATSLISTMRSMLGFKSENHVESELLESMLVTFHNLINYRSLYKSSLQLEPVLDLLIFDANNPHSLVFQIDMIRGYLSKLPKNGSSRLNQAELLALEGYTRILLSSPSVLSEDEEGYRRGLDVLMAELSDIITHLSVNISSMYFSHSGMQQQLNASNTEINTTQNEV